jgi:hypothetical protein
MKATSYIKIVMNNMKHILLLVLVGLSFSSCSVDNNDNFNLEIVPINNVEMPASFTVNNVSQISVYYNNPSGCYEFSNFYYSTIGNDRTVAVYCKKYTGQNCGPNVSYNENVPLNFKPKVAGTYNFRFWSGVNNEGVDQYIEHEVVVTD